MPASIFVEPHVLMPAHPGALPLRDGVSPWATEEPTGYAQPGRNHCKVLAYAQRLAGRESQHREEAFLEGPGQRSEVAIAMDADFILPGTPLRRSSAITSRGQAGATASPRWGRALTSRGLVFEVGVRRKQMLDAPPSMAPPSALRRLSTTNMSRGRARGTTSGGFPAPYTAPTVADNQPTEVDVVIQSFMGASNLVDAENSPVFPLELPSLQQRTPYCDLVQRQNHGGVRYAAFDNFEIGTLRVHIRLVHERVYTYIHICIFMYVYIYVRAHMYIHMCVYACPCTYAAQEWTNRTVAEHACKKMGRAAARRNAPKQPRAIRAGPHPGGGKIGPPIPGVYLIFFDTGVLSRHGGTLHNGSLYDFLLSSHNTGGLSDFTWTFRGFIEDIFFQR